jgi:hypothetical protein
MNGIYDVKEPAKLEVNGIGFRYIKPHHWFSYLLELSIPFIPEITNNDN